MVLFALPNAYGKGFYPIGTEILLHRASVDVRWAGLIRLFENQRVFSRALLYSSKDSNAFLPRRGPFELCSKRRKAFSEDDDPADARKP